MAENPNKKTITPRERTYLLTESELRRLVHHELALWETTNPTRAQSTVHEAQVDEEIEHYADHLTEPADGDLSAQ
jgi:hypothetical protein